MIDDDGWETIEPSPAPARPAPPSYVRESDSDLVERFVAEHGESFRYVGKTKRWMVYTERRWEEDSSARVIEAIKAVCREAASEVPSLRDARVLEGTRTIGNVERLARSHPRLRAADDAWDRDPLLLNTPAGTVDLRTGIVRAHRAEDYITRMTAVAPDRSGDHPIWTSVLARALPDGHQRAYLQRFLGYCLTGETTAQALLAAYGTGANSKGIIFNTARIVMGDYATGAAAETFLSTRHDRHPAELAVLAGKRLVLASEIDEGRYWNSMLINRVTGGDPIVARVMRGDPFEFAPQFKLIALTNHMPELRGVNEATRRRFNVLRFGVTIPPDERDPDLMVKLAREHPAILGWMIDGAVAYREKGGLHPPESIRVSTSEYLERENEVEDWLAECVSTDDLDAWTSTAALYDSWKEWAGRRGAFVGKQKRLTTTLEEMGFRYGHNPEKTARGFYGLWIR